MRTPIAAVALALGLLAGTAQASEEDVRRAYDLIVARDYEAARQVVEPLAEAGDPAAQHMLGYLEQFGFGAEKNLQRAIDLYYAAALDGNADAQFALGELAFLGDGVEEDPERAAGWYRLAAEQDHDGAETRLGQMRAEGRGLPQDSAEAASHFRRAARRGDPQAQFFLANAFFAGEGVRQSYDEAGDWYALAAEQGHPDAAYNLALLHADGLLSSADAAHARRLMRQAAEAGIAEAMVALGLMIHNAPDGEETAADWFERAAEAGDPQGQFLFAVALAEGDSRPADPAAALVWADKALLASDELPAGLRQSAEDLRADLVAALAAKGRR